MKRAWGILVCLVLTVVLAGPAAGRSAAQGADVDESPLPAPVESPLPAPVGDPVYCIGPIDYETHDGSGYHKRRYYVGPGLPTGPICAEYLPDPAEVLAERIRLISLSFTGGAHWVIHEWFDVDAVNIADWARSILAPVPSPTPTAQPAQVPSPTPAPSAAGDLVFVGLWAGQCDMWAQDPEGAEGVILFCPAGRPAAECPAACPDHKD